MELRSVKICGFKNITKTTLNLTKITSLLSVNNYGKSNILEGIIFGFDFIKGTQAEKSVAINSKTLFPLNKFNLYADFEFEINLLVKIGNETFDVIYGFILEWGSSKNKGKIKEEYLRIKDAGSLKYTAFVERDGKGSFYRTSKTGRCDNPIAIEDKELILNKIAAYDKLFYYEIIKKMNSMKAYVLRHLDTGNTFKYYPWDLKAIRDPNPKHGSNLPKLLFELKTNHPDKFALIINTVKDIYPFITKIDVEEFTLSTSLEDLSKGLGLADKIYATTVIDKNIGDSIPFTMMSDGVKRILALYTLIVLGEIDGLMFIGVEEPENSINPGLLRKYLIGLDNLIDNSKVVFTSHSPFLINYIDTEKLYIGVPNNKGISAFRKLRTGAISKMNREAASNEMMIGEYIFDLMSGTEEEIDTLSGYLEDE